MNHSPGPWHVDSERYITHAAGEPVARVTRFSDDRDKDNQRLIAAAPEMLELLREMANPGMCMCGHGESCSVCMRPAHVREREDRTRELLERLK